MAMAVWQALLALSLPPAMRNIVAASWGPDIEEVRNMTFIRSYALPLFEESVVTD